MTLQRLFNSWISPKVLCSKVKVLFTSSIGVAIYDVSPISYSYLYEDTDTVTFVLMAMLTTVV